MQIIHEFGISYLKYYQLGKNNTYPEPKRCRYCNDQLVKNGYYQRYMISFSRSYRIVIRRYRCRHCQRTVSVLPSFLLPYLQHLLSVILFSLIRYLKQREIHLERQSLFFHLKRFKKNLNGIIMYFRAHCLFEKLILPKEARLLAYLNKIESGNYFDFSRDYFTTYGISFMAN